MTDSPLSSGRIPVFQLVTNFQIGGTERHVSSLVGLLDPNRFEVNVGCFRKFGEFLERVARQGVPIDEYPIHTLLAWQTLRRQLELARVLRERRIQVFHAYGFYANAFGVPAARWARVPLVVASIRDIGDHLTVGRRRLQRLVCHLADCVLVNADAVRQHLRDEGFPARKLTVIRNGINLDGFSPRTSQAALRQALGLPPLGALVTVVSRLNPMKGIECFLDAAGLVAARVPDAHFLVVGDNVEAPGYREHLQGVVAERGLAARVTFLGFRNDVADLLSASTVSVLPSLSEGLSNVLLESMAVGVPVVATRVGGSAEAVEHGVTGLLVPPADAAALAHGITLLLEHLHLAKCYGEQARQRVCERFSDERMARETEELYLAWLARKRRHGVTPDLRERTA